MEAVAEMNPEEIGKFLETQAWPKAFIKTIKSKT